MTPTVRVDDEVLEELKKRAVALGLVFGTPNEVLRHILELITVSASSFKFSSAICIDLVNFGAPEYLNSNPKLFPAFLMSKSSSAC